MASFNKCILAGNIGKIDELKRVGNEKTAVLRFSLAVTDSWGKEQTTMWVGVTVWAKQAEALAKFLAKGMNVQADGRLQVREYQDKAGATRTAVEVRADNVTVFTKKGEAGAGSTAEGQPTKSARASLEEIPF